MFSLLVWVSLLNFPIMVIYLFEFKIQIETCIARYSSLNPLALLILIIVLFHKQLFQHLCYTSGGGGYYTKFYMGGSIARSIYNCRILIEKAPLLQIFHCQKVHVKTPLQAYLRILHPFSIPWETTQTMLQSPLILADESESSSTTFQNQKNGIPKSQIYLPCHTPQLVKPPSFHNYT